MLYVGIDYHKKYSVISVQNETGSELDSFRVNHQYPKMFDQRLGSYGQPLSVTFESSINWPWPYSYPEKSPQML